MSDEDVRTGRGALQYMYRVAQPLIFTLDPQVIRTRALVGLL
jgi:hypothetical protein